MITGFHIGLAFLMDLILGDPRRLPHPVRSMGWLIDRLESLIRANFASPAGLSFGGALMTVVVVGFSYGLVGLILHFLELLAPWLMTLAWIILAYTTLAARSLYSETWRVARALDRGDLDQARYCLSMVVGRETDNLDREDIVRAVIETLAENLSDGVIAPLFYLALGGPALAMAYKAVNTLDSMIGYKNERYINLGRFAARLDDAANYIPARIAALSIVLSAWLIGLDGGRALYVWLKDGGLHHSPNAGRPEAAMAGALGIRLGGPNYYGGRLVDKPYIGRNIHPPSLEGLKRSEKIMLVSSGLMVVFIILFLGLIQ